MQQEKDVRTYESLSAPLSQVFQMALNAKFIEPWQRQLDTSGVGLVFTFCYTAQLFFS